jgi:2,3-bisphosphoglycerate-dependent phosphoglycerate mutase
VTVLYLVRHAHADYAPDEQRPLSAQGVADAGRVARLLGQAPITAIYASPYRRSWQTVQSLAGKLDLPLHFEPDLRERTLGRFAAELDFLDAVQQTWADPGFAHPGGEPNAAAQRRGVAVVQRLLARHRDQEIVAATHGNLLALVLQHFDPAVGYEFWQALTMPDVYELRVEGDVAWFTRLWRGGALAS